MHSSISHTAKNNPRTLSITRKNSALIRNKVKRPKAYNINTSGILATNVKTNTPTAHKPKSPQSILKLTQKLTKKEQKVKTVISVNELALRLELDLMLGNRNDFLKRLSNAVAQNRK